MPDLRCTYRPVRTIRIITVILTVSWQEEILQRKQPRQAVTALRREKAEVPMRMHTRIWKGKRLRQRAAQTARQQTACIIKNVSAMPERSVQKAETPVIAARQSVRHSSVDVHKIRRMPDTGFDGQSGRDRKKDQNISFYKSFIETIVLILFCRLT